jgi:hypothetical protein
MEVVAVGRCRGFYRNEGGEEDQKKKNMRRRRSSVKRKMEEKRATDGEVSSEPHVYREPPHYW